MRKILILSVLAFLPLSSATYGQQLGEGTGGAAARNNGPTGASGGGHNEPMGFSLLATRGCWPDSTLGCNATPYNGFIEPTQPEVVSTDAAKSGKPSK